MARRPAPRPCSAAYVGLGALAVCSVLVAGVGRVAGVRVRRTGRPVPLADASQVLLRAAPAPRRPAARLAAADQALLPGPAGFAGGRGAARGLLGCCVVAAAAASRP